MDQREIDDILSGRSRGIGVAFLRSLLLLASWAYCPAVRLRRALHRMRLLPSRRAGVPVISVGNLTTGGTGKTPMVAWVVERLRQAGRSPAILTRGYKALEGVSDEAELLARAFDGPDGVPVIVDPDRAAGARRAVANGADVLVMDDGFQHLRLRRDLDIVLIDSTNPFGFGHCLPRGLLREPAAALRSADAIVLTRTDLVAPEQLAELRRRMEKLAPRASLHQAVHRPVAVLGDDGQRRPLDAVAGRKVCAFCGIGNPDAFFAALTNLHARLVDRRAFDDHVEYSRKLVESFRARAAECEADVLVTTQKDYVKLAGADLGRPVWQLVIEMDVTDGSEGLAERIRSVAAEA